MTNILFVCKFNKMRSTFAEAYFNKHNTDPNVRARSAGLILGEDAGQDVLNMLSARYGLKLKQEPEALTMDMLRWQDILVIVADDVPSSIFKDHRFNQGEVLVWDVPDKIEGIETIFKKVDELIKKLGGGE